MTFSIRTKLFLTLLTASSLAVAGMHAFMAWSFNNGLLELAESRQQERLEQIVERLIERYGQDGGWQRIAADKGIWIGILTGFDRSEDPAGENPQDWAPPRTGPRRHQARMMRHRFEEPGIWPPTPAVERARQPDGPPLPLEMRLMLLDQDGTPIQAVALDQAFGDLLQPLLLATFGQFHESVIEGPGHEGVHARHRQGTGGQEGQEEFGADGESHGDEYGWPGCRK